MLYKTIVLEMLKDRPQLHEQLRRQRKLLETMNLYSARLKACHVAWMEQLPKNEAAEMALKDLEADLPAESTASDEAFPLDDAIAFITHHTPPA